MAIRPPHRSTPCLTLFVSLLVGCTSVGPPVEVTKRGWIFELPEAERVVVRNLLQSKQFDQLEIRFQHLQARYEQGHLDDRSLTLEYQGFYDISPENEPYFNEWVTSKPSSYPARLARGIYYRLVAEKKRGQRFVRDTPREHMMQMAQYLALAETDLRASLSLTPKPIVSLLNLMTSSKMRGDSAGSQTWLDHANRIDPQNYGARRRYMISLVPRWGGSYEAMWQFLALCKNQNTSGDYLRVFESLIYLDQAHAFEEMDQKEKARPLYRTVLELLEGINTIERLNALKGLASTGRGGNLSNYSKEVEEALRLSPKDRVMLGYRGYILFTRGDRREGLQAFRQGAELGDLYSQLQLAQHLYYGVPSVFGSNQEEAVLWATRAAEQGYAPAKEFLKEVAKHRSRSEEVGEH